MISHHNWRDGDQATIDAFHEVFYRTERYATVTWFGHEMWKYPTDVLIYAEMVHALRPSLIVECGAYRGGSGLFFAHLQELLGEGGRVLSVDIVDDDDLGPDPHGNVRPTHPLLSFVKGSSVDPVISGPVRTAMDAVVEVGHGVLLILDSDHTAPHVLAELDAYGAGATVIVVEDTNLGHEVLPAWGPGPREAVDEWLARSPDWYADRAMERLLLTCAPGGFLRRA